MAFARNNTHKPKPGLILDDDLQYVAVGYHDSNLVSTPNIARLSSEGIVITNVSDSSDVCSIAR